VAEPIPAAYRDNPEVRHEKSDVDTKAIIRFGIGLAVTLIVTFLLLFALFAYFSAREMRFGRGPARVQSTDQLPPEPRLEVSPRANLEELRAAEQKVLENYGWVDKEKNVVRIPIERAMEIIAERGLPARKPSGEIRNDGRVREQQ
jgi:hypothetical protein